MADLSDTQIRSDLRTVLTEAGIDPNRTHFTCTSGTVRILGDVLGVHNGEPVRPAQIGAMEESIRHTRGVNRVYLHLENWERSATGEWVPVVTETKTAPPEASTDR